MKKNGFTFCLYSDIQYMKRSKDVKSHDFHHLKCNYEESKRIEVIPFF